jgi:hypothetical protein
MTYTIDGSMITCHICGMTSHNPNDVENHYCGNCHIFHDDNDQLTDNEKKFVALALQGLALRQPKTFLMTIRIAQKLGIMLELLEYLNDWVHSNNR